jgi:hypothetical protein
MRLPRTSVVTSESSQFQASKADSTVMSHSGGIRPAVDIGCILSKAAGCLPVCLSGNIPACIACAGPGIASCL